MKRLAVAALAFVFASLFLLGCGGSPKKVAIRVNKDSVTEDEFYKRVQSVSIADLAPAAQGMGQPKAGDYVVERIIMEAILNQLAAQKGVKPTDAEVTRLVDIAKRNQNNPMIRILPPNPFRTDEDYKRDARLSLLQLGLAIAPLKITDDEIKKKYDTFKQQLTPEDQYHLRVISVSSKEKAAKALDTLKKGVAFETVALTQSEDQNSKSKSGDIGNVPQSALTPDFLAAIKDLKPGDYTKTAINIGGAAVPGQPTPQARFLIAQVVEKLPGKPPTIDEAKFVIQQGILREKDPNFGQRLQQDVMNARKAADIQVNLPGYDKLVSQIKNAAAPPSAAVPAAPTGR